MTVESAVISQVVNGIMLDESELARLARNETTIEVINEGIMRGKIRGSRGSYEFLVESGKDRIVGRSIVPIPKNNYSFNLYRTNVPFQQNPPRRLERFILSGEGRVALYVPGNLEYDKLKKLLA